MVQRDRQLPSAEALFRYRIVSAVKALELGGLSRRAAVCQVARQPQLSAEGQIRCVSERSVWRWLASWEAAELAGLERARRQRLQGSQVLSDGLLSFLERERKADPRASIPELLRRAREQGLIGDDEKPERSTVWRAMQRLGIDTRRRKQPRDADMRRFEYVLRMQMMLLDGKHFRAGVARAKRVALYLLDDATRYGLDVLVTTSEHAEAVLKLWHHVLCRIGLMDSLFIDHGPGFIANDVAAVAARLGVHLIVGTAGYPEGHGKIERFNQSAKARVLRGLDGAPDVDPDCGALTLRLRHDLFEVYNHLPHESLDGDTPQQRFASSPRPLRPAASDAWLINAFTLPLERRVSADHIVTVDGTLYELPRGYGGSRVTLYRRLLELTPHGPALDLEHDGRLVRLHPVDKHFNATSGRAPRGSASSDETQAVPAKSASTLHFERDHRSMLAPDGGFRDTKENDR